MFKSKKDDYEFDNIHVYEPATETTEDIEEDAIKKTSWKLKFRGYAQNAILLILISFGFWGIAAPPIGGFTPLEARFLSFLAAIPICITMFCVLWQLISILSYILDLFDNWPQERWRLRIWLEGLWEEIKSLLHTILISFCFFVPLIFLLLFD